MILENRLKVVWEKETWNGWKAGGVGHVTVFDQSYVVSARAIISADTLFVAS